MKYLQRIALFVCVCLAACNSKPAETKSAETLFANFYIRYLETEKLLKAEAFFLKGDSLKNAKPFQPEAGVSFQNSGTESRTLPNQSVRYGYENLADYPNKFEFKFENSNGEDQTQTFELNRAGNFSVQSELSKSKGGELKLEEDKLAEGESFVFLITDSENQTVSLITKLDEDNAFKIPAEKLKELAVGEIKFYPVKKQVKEVTENGYHYTSTIEYYSRTYTFKLAE